jgi:hypothetical protein
METTVAQTTTEQPREIQVLYGGTGLPERLALEGRCRQA